MEDFSDNYDFTMTTGRYDRIDFTCTAIKYPKRQYVGDVKCYHKNVRRYDAYPDYQIDYAKLDSICKAAETTKAIPVLVVYFTEVTVVWRLDKVDWRSTAAWRNVNKYGQNYGKEKEKALQAFLKIEDAVWKRYERR